MVAAAAVMVAVLPATAFAAPGDRWQGDATVASDGTPLYEALNVVGRAEVQAWAGRTISISIANASHPSGTYSLRASGRWAQSTAPGDHATFSFTGTNAALVDAAGTTVCAGGRVVAGGDQGLIWIVETTFAPDC